MLIHAECHSGTLPRDHFTHILVSTPSATVQAAPLPIIIHALHEGESIGEGEHGYWGVKVPVSTCKITGRKGADEPQCKVKE